MVEPIVGGLIGIILLFILLFSGMPIAVGLGLSGLIGIFLISGGPTGIFLGMGTVASDQLWHGWGLLAVPMFILMGNIIAEHGIGAELYSAVYRWLGRLPGGLAIASTVMSALFGFMCGSGIAGTATIGRLALVEMEKRGYNQRLALGTLALAGGLSALIPPSILMIIYAVQAEVSMGWLFFAGILPGLLLMVLMCLYILLRACLNPNIAPKGECFTVREKMIALIHVIPVVALFIVVLGGIYSGIWSAMEAGGAACLVSFFICLAYRKVSWSRITAAATGAAKTTVIIYMLIIGAGLLSIMFFMSGISELIKEALMGLAIPRWGTVIVILFVMMIMGMFMDVMALLLIMIPNTVPIITSLGYDPVWWGIIIIVSSEMAMITPPVGIHLFVIQGIAPRGTTLTDVALGAAPFVGVLWVLVGLLIAFPDIVMWLPSTMRGG